MIEQPHVVVLAGGEGKRLVSLTRALYGTDLPKQFAALDGDRSLLQQTVERALALTTADRISVIVTGQREAIAREQLAAYPGVELVVQPRGLDTGPGLLLPLIRILARAHRTRVVFLPSDHYLSSSAPLLEALRTAAHGALADRIALIGVTPTGPEVEYGWIVGGAHIGQTGAVAVTHFEEKPEPHRAEQLWQRGGLWNTFISAGPASAFWGLARRHVPRHAAAFESYATRIGRADEHRALEAAYDAMSPANFSRDVLAHAQSLAAIPVHGTGWSDWGSPKRVFASLRGTASHARLVARIRGSAALAS